MPGILTPSYGPMPMSGNIVPVNTPDINTSVEGGYKLGQIMSGVPQAMAQAQLEQLRGANSLLPLHRQILEGAVAKIPSEILASELANRTAKAGLLGLPGTVVEGTGDAVDNTPLIPAGGIPGGPDQRTLENAAPVGKAVVAPQAILNRMQSEANSAPPPDAQPLMPGIRFSPELAHQYEWAKATMPINRLFLGEDLKRTRPTQMKILGPNNTVRVQPVSPGESVTLAPGETLPGHTITTDGQGNSFAIDAFGTATPVVVGGVAIQPSAQPSTQPPAVNTPGGPLNTGKGLGTTDSLRKEVQGNQIVKSLGSVKEAADLMDVAMNESKSRQNTIASDRAIIEAFNRFTNPKMGLRPSMYLTTPSEQALWERIGGLINKGWRGGEGLLDTDREAFAALVRNTYPRIVQEALGEVSPQIATAKAQGYDLGKILPKELSDAVTQKETPSTGSGNFEPNHRYRDKATGKIFTTDTSGKPMGM